MTPVQGPAEPRSLPEVSVKAIQLVGEAMAHWLPHGGSPKIVSGWTEQEWNVAAWLAYWQGAVPWVLSRAAEDGVDINPEVRSRLEYVNGLMRARTERLLAEAAEVLRALTEEGVPVVPLKGTVISQRYIEDPLSRGMRDVDLLIASSDHERTSGVLLSLGYRPSSQARTTSVWLRGTPNQESWSPDHLRPVDLHTKAEKDTAHLGLDVDHLMWQRSVQQTLLGVPDVRVPPHVAVFIHTALHASRGLVMGNPSLSHLRDLEGIAGSLEEPDWTELLETADDITRRHLFPALMLLTRYAPDSVPDVVVTALEDSASRRMRKWIPRTGYGRASPSSYRIRTQIPRGLRGLFRLVDGPKEHLRLVFPPRQHVIGSHRWAETMCESGPFHMPIRSSTFRVSGGHGDNSDRRLERRCAATKSVASCAGGSRRSATRAESTTWRGLSLESVSISSAGLSARRAMATCFGPGIAWATRSHLEPLRRWTTPLPLRFPLRVTPTTWLLCFSRKGRFACSEWPEFHGRGRVARRGARHQMETPVDHREPFSWGV